jgi:hypothetical protein
MPSQRSWLKQGTRSLHSAHANTRLKEGSAISSPGKQRSPLHLQGSNYLIPREIKKKKGTRTLLASRRPAQIYARIERGNSQAARGEKTERRLREIRGGLRRDSYGRLEPRARGEGGKSAHLGVRGGGRCGGGDGPRLVHLHRVRGAGGVAPTRQRGHVEGGGGAAGRRRRGNGPLLCPLSLSPR